MKCSLWQGGVLLGRMRLPFEGDDPRSFGGMFEPTPAFANVGPVAQTRLAAVPGAPIIQQPFAPRQERARETGRASGRIDVAALEPLPEDQRRGVPADRLLEIHDEQGDLVPADFILVAELPPATAGSSVGLQTACANHGIPYSGWYIGVRRASLGVQR